MRLYTCLLPWHGDSLVLAKGLGWRQRGRKFFSRVVIEMHLPVSSFHWNFSIPSILRNSSTRMCLSFFLSFSLSFFFCFEPCVVPTPIILFSRPIKSRNFFPSWFPKLLFERDMTCRFENYKKVSYSNISIFFKKNYTLKFPRKYTLKLINCSSAWQLSKRKKNPCIFSYPFRIFYSFIPCSQKKEILSQLLTFPDVTDRESTTDSFPFESATTTI